MTDLANILTGNAPTVTDPCAVCGHAREEHGTDPRDTGCTECMCPEFRAAMA